MSQRGRADVESLGMNGLSCMHARLCKHLARRRFNKMPGDRSFRWNITPPEDIVPRENLIQSLLLTRISVSLAAHGQANVRADIN